MAVKLLYQNVFQPLMNARRVIFSKLVFRRYSTLAIYSGLFLTLMLMSQPLLAQDQRIGFVDTNEILAKLPEYNGIQQQLGQEAQAWKEELQKIEEELAELEKEFQSREILYTDEVKAQKQKEISDKRSSITVFIESKFGPEGEYFKRQAELLQPLQRKIHEAIMRVTEQGGYTLVLDRAQNTGLIYASPEANLNDLVLEELGINPDSSN